MSNDTMYGHLCVFRHGPDKPWIPVGELRNEIREGITGQHDRLVSYLIRSADADPDPASRAQQHRDIRKWARRWYDIHDKRRTDTYTDPRGREYGYLRMAITPASGDDVTFIDPHAT